MHVCDMYVIFFLLISIEFQWLLLLLFAYSALPTRNLKSMCEKVHRNAHFNDNVPIYVLFRLVLTRIFAVTYIYILVCSAFLQTIFYDFVAFSPRCQMTWMNIQNMNMLSSFWNPAVHHIDRFICLEQLYYMRARSLARSQRERERVTNTHRAHHPIVSCNACLLILIANIRQL